jgi:hypothetical protein
MEHDDRLGDGGAASSAFLGALAGRRPLGALGPSLIMH